MLYRAKENARCVEHGDLSNKLTRLNWVTERRLEFVTVSDSTYTKRNSFFFFQAEDGIRDRDVTGVQTCALPIYAPRVPRTVVKHPISVRAERERLATRQRLFAYLKEHPAPPALRYAQMPIARPGAGAAAADAPIVTGFYVNWDDNSLASLRSHIDALDWVVAEWGFVGRGVDPLPVRFAADRRALPL